MLVHPTVSEEGENIEAVRNRDRAMLARKNEEKAQVKAAKAKEREDAKAIAREAKAKEKLAQAKTKGQARPQRERKPKDGKEEGSPAHAANEQKRPFNVGSLPEHSHETL